MADLPPSVAVTGMGLVLPTGTGLAAADAVFAGRSAVVHLNGTVDIAGATGAPAAAFLPPEGTDAEDRAVQMATAAADEAWRGARLDDLPLPADRVATLVSLSKGGIFALTRQAEGMAPRKKGTRGRRMSAPAARPRTSVPRRVLPRRDDRPRIARPDKTGRGTIQNIPPGYGDSLRFFANLSADPAAAGRFLAGRYGLTGPVLTPVTACASGGHALAWGAGLIRRGAADAALVGAAEASLHPLVLGAYRRMGVLADAGGDPGTSVRPFSATRRGFAVGEGAGVLVLESAASAARRGVRPLAHLTGWATGAHHAGMTDVEASGAALARLMRTALARAGTAPEAVDLVHAHGTATPANDLAEARAVRAALGGAAEAVSVTSTKGSHGHLLGAATAVETVLTVLAVGRGLVPPTANLTDPDPAIGLDCTPLTARRRPIRTAVKIAGGFGGQLVALVLSQPQEGARC